MHHRDSSADSTAARFWIKYLSVLKKASVPERRYAWYRRHTERYIEAHPGKRLADHRPADVADYIDGIAEKKALREWQLAQTVDALHKLFCGLLRVEWCRKVDWDRWK